VSDEEEKEIALVLRGMFESRMQSGTRESHFYDCWSLSPNGQTLWMEHRDDDLAGQMTVLDRAG
jgi:hypothetical protein